MERERGGEEREIQASCLKHAHMHIHISQYNPNCIMCSSVVWYEKHMADWVSEHMLRVHFTICELLSYRINSHC